MSAQRNARCDEAIPIVARKVTTRLAERGSLLREPASDCARALTALIVSLPRHARERAGETLEPALAANDAARARETGTLERLGAYTRGSAPRLAAIDGQAVTTASATGGASASGRAARRADAAREWRTQIDEDVRFVIERFEKLHVTRGCEGASPTRRS